MGLSSKELKLEEEYLEKVKETLERIIKSAEKSIDYNKDNINYLKRFMWENISDYTDEERAAALYEVDTEVEFTNQRIDNVDRYKRALDSPYFAKVVFKEDESSDEYPIYIGITSVKDNGINFLVFDWRSPISSMFYNYETGKASYDAPIGEIAGEILSKMQFKIANGKMVRCFKSSINIDDDYLQEILAKSSTSKMESIVSTIQREQNLVIRNDEDNCVIVQGIAGSGKTSVALHRIAYLLYKNKELSSNNVLIFSPNDVFSDYISDVLPELGEENVLTTTLGEFASTFLKPHKNVEKYSEFLERVYNDKSNVTTIGYKMYYKFKYDLDKFLKQYEDDIVFYSDMKYNNKTILKKEMEMMIKDKYKKFPMNERLDLISENLCLSLKLPMKSKNRIKKILIENSNIELDSFKLYKMFLDSEFYNDDNRNFAAKKISFEDIMGLVYLKFNLEGYPVYNNIKHVVIDEAQDYTKFQMDILSKIFKRSSFTILGDINQSINPFYDYQSLKELLKIFKDSRYLELTKSYRSSEEIIEYSNNILGIDNSCSVRRPNKIPVTFKDADKSSLVSVIKDDLKDMDGLGINKVAVITKDAKAAKNIFNEIEKDDKNIQLVLSSINAINSNVVVIPSYLSKGLEFDGVIVYNDPNNEYSEDERRLFYVVCTRAQHKLNVYNEPSKRFY